MAQENRPDLVISDVTMPVMDGFELCQKIREDATLGDLPVILLTAMGSARDVVHGLNVGADNYVTKPYDSALLLERVRGALGKAQHGLPTGKVHDLCRDRRRGDRRAGRASADARSAAVNVLQCAGSEPAPANHTR